MRRHDYSYQYGQCYIISIVPATSYSRTSIAHKSTIPNIEWNMPKSVSQTANPMSSLAACKCKGYDSIQKIQTEVPTLLYNCILLLVVTPKCETPKANRKYTTRSEANYAGFMFPKYKTHWLRLLTHRRNTPKYPFKLKLNFFSANGTLDFDTMNILGPFQKLRNKTNMSPSITIAISYNLGWALRSNQHPLI